MGDVLEVRTSILGRCIGYVLIVGSIWLLVSMWSGPDIYEFWLFGFFVLIADALIYRYLLHRGVYLRVSDQGLWHEDVKETIPWEAIERLESAEVGGARDSVPAIALYARREIPAPTYRTSLRGLERFLKRILPSLRYISDKTTYVTLPVYYFSTHSRDVVLKKARAHLH